jgi:hypothetical protein
MPEGPSRRNVRAQPSRLRYFAVTLVALPFVAVAGLLAVVALSSGSIRAGRASLAQIALPTGGGQISQVVAIGGRERQVVPVKLVGDQVLPVRQLPSGYPITVQATIRRPGWISWLTGSEQQVQVTEMTPAPHLLSTFLTRGRGSQLTVQFSSPVAAVGAGAVGTKPSVRALPAPTSSYNLPEQATAGTADVAAAARSWEIPTVTPVSWFPAGANATAVATPAPGTTIAPDTRITLTFSKDVSSVLGGHLPPVAPSGSGSWRRLNAHSIQFVPEGYGYGLGANVSVSLPSDVSLVGGRTHGSDPVGQWTVPVGSTLALQELLAELGYLPLNFTPSSAASTTTTTTTTPTVSQTTATSAATTASTATSIAGTPAAEEAAIINPPQGTFSWRYPNTPAQLKALWSPTGWTELTRGAVMAFENANGLTTDGIAGPIVWRALIKAAVADKQNTFGYTFVMVSKALPETIKVWHNGSIVVQGLANTGIPQSPTADGTFAVYEHIPVGTMSGTNPNGTPYHDTGIPWISYFNGGDALHGFIRASYGFPQSLGCVEMPFSEAGQVYPYTPIGTIVHISG